MDTYKQHIIESIVNRFSTDAEHRHEALREVLALSNQTMSDSAIAELAEAIPPLPKELYSKWATMFAERIIETVDPRQIQDLCEPTEQNQSTLALLFAMFMETETMEKQKAKDMPANPPPQ